ncbi:peptidoglycan-binding protein [Halobacillus sp. A1]|uniref:S41 family peptidase n=1 Tax=Halobacillus sp. A1 TaxID=2880262 RepID=UPI0020A69B65|nr:S41 family peptidase [Halobacillus sp. A1]MCP3031406.1 peptidoglycan-binding protein [Halobacillus sp. A1]
MNVKPRYVAIIVGLALLLGAAGSYVGMQYFGVSSNDNAGQSANVEKEAENFADLSEDEQKSFIEGLSGDTDIEKVEQAYQMIQENSLIEAEDNQLIEGAIEGMLDTLDDPYSTYMDKETMEQFDQSIESSFQGIGAEVSMVDEKVTIVAPIKGSPAEEAGLKPNDQILEVDGESVEGLDLYDAVSKIRGEKGSEVTLTIERPGSSDSLEIDLVRDDIPLETVYKDTKTVDGKKAGIIEITSFSEKTSKEFEDALSELEEENIEGLVIDVRGNPGGLFTDVQEILEQFITDEQPYVQVEDSAGEKSEYRSNLQDMKDYPITVLQDEGSASASEILSAAMNEAGGYDIVGTKSFGKGTVQQTMPMGDGSTIKLTLYKWLTPEGNWIHEKGVEPTVEVKQPEYFYTNPVEIEEELSYDDNAEQIENVQIMLEGLGYEPGRTDGYFSKETEAAVSEFQADQGLETSGKVNEETGGKIQELIIEQVRSGENDQQMDKAIDVLFE